MKKKIMFFIIVSASITSINLRPAIAQNTSPYWSLAGNDNAGAGSKLGTTNNVSLRFYTNDVQRMIINSAAGNVGIGIASPVNILTVQSGGTTPAALWLNGLNSPVFVGFGETVSSELLLAGASNTAVNRAVFQGRRSRGTLAAPSVVLTNDYITSLLGSAYDGSSFQNPALVSIFVDGAPSAGHVPARISLVTGTNSSDRVERLKVGYTGNFDFNNGQMTITQATGNVGIGTSTPGVRLDVAGTNAWDLANTEGDFRVGDGTYRLKMGVANGGGGAGDAYIASANRLFLGAGSSVIRTQTIAITSGGRVGIGTEAPTAKLQVVAEDGGTGYGIQSTGGVLGGYFIGDGGAATGTVYGAFCNASGSAGTRIGVYGYASGGTTNNWGGYFPAKTYTNELRVGGTQGATGYVAAINGKLIATEVRVEVIASWPDYVFKNGYKLMPIEELETKINTDKHLPGIPAASELKENGIMLGEMQTKTMEKVEEMTLYIIELNNKIKLLEQKIDELTKEKN